MSKKPRGLTPAELPEEKLEEEGYERYTYDVLEHFPNGPLTGHIVVLMDPYEKRVNFGMQIDKAKDNPGQQAKLLHAGLKNRCVEIDVGCRKRDENGEWNPVKGFKITDLERLRMYSEGNDLAMAVAWVVAKGIPLAPMSEG